MSIAVIIVNYETPELSIAAVDSVLARDHGGRAVEVHLVDNASTGSDTAVFTKAHAEKGWGKLVTFWFETENHGFGRGNNVVLISLAGRKTPPEFVFFLNPDAKLENEAIDILATALEDDPAAGASGAAMCSPNGQATSACFRFPTMVSEVVSTLDFGPLYKLVPHGHIALEPNHPEGPVAWVSGAAMMVRFSAIRDTGFFDPDFFLYYEEVELMWRLAKAGHRTLYVPRAKVLHVAGAATQFSTRDRIPRRRPDFLYYSWRMYFQKTYGRRYALFTALIKMPAVFGNVVIARLRGKQSDQPIGFYQDHWRYVIWPLLKGSK